MSLLSESVTTVVQSNTVVTDDLVANESVQADVISCNDLAAENISVDGTLSSENAISAAAFLSVHQFKGFPQNTFYTIGNFTAGSELYQTGVLAPNGKIYCMPARAANVLVIDPVTDTLSFIPVPNPTSLYLFFGGVVATNGKIYGVPSQATYILIIDPSNDTVDTTTITGLPATGAKWAGGVLAPNGLIFCMPRAIDPAGVLIINPFNNTVDYTTIVVPRSVAPGDWAWTGGVLAPNGKIYGIPEAETKVLIIDPVALTGNVTTITGISGNYNHGGGVLAPNGKIYAIPLYNFLLVIDPSTNTFTETNVLPAVRNGYGGTLAPNGKIYCAAYEPNYVTIIDPTTNTVNTTSITGLNPIFGKFIGSVLAPNGNIYLVPHNYPSVVVVRTGLPSQPNWMLQAAFNKF